MKIALINCSPKSKDSCSDSILFNLRPLIENNNNILKFHLNKLSKDDFNKIYTCNIIVFSYPLYVDSLPSHFLQFLIEYEAFLKNKENKNIIVYAIGNCGFFEDIQCKLSLDIIKNWCNKVNFKYGQGIGIGGGPMLGNLKNPSLGHGPKKSLGQALTLLANNILNTNSGENIFIKPNFPRKLYILAAHYGWNSSAKANNLKKVEIKRKLS